MDLTADVHYEEGAYWAHVRELPGCFASGHTLDELMEVLEEAIGLCMSPDEGTADGCALASRPLRLNLSFDRLPLSA